MSSVSPSLRHRPDHADGLRQAAQLLVRQGLKARDVGAALQLSELAVAQLLDAREPTPGAAPVSPIRRK